MLNYNVFGIKISCITRDSVINEIEELLKKKSQIFITTPNPEHIMLAQKNLAFRKALLHADLASPDGVGVVWAVKKIYNHEKDINKQIERVTGVDLLNMLCDWAHKNNNKNLIKIGLLGARKGIAQTAADRIKRKYSNLDIISFPEYIYGDKDTEIIQKINEAKPSILFVALGAPKQELFISKYLQSMSTVRIAMGVGGAFDVVSGKLKRPPLWIQDLGLEWLFRLIQEPWRWKRQLRLVAFVWKVMSKAKSQR